MFPIAASLIRRFALAAVGGVLVLLGACTTLNDYRAMTPQARAQDLCQRQGTIRQLKREADGARHAMADAQLALDRGYRVHRYCREVSEPGPVTHTECRRVGDREQCVERRKERTREVCDETPVPIDAGLEASKLSAFSAQWREQLGRYEQAWQQCLARAVTLTPEQAFSER